MESEVVVRNKSFRTGVLLVTTMLIAPAWVFAQDSANGDRSSGERSSSDRSSSERSTGERRSDEGAVGERRASEGRGERRTAGTLSSIGRGSIIVHTSTNAYQVFAVDRDTVLSQPLQLGARVTVLSLANDDPDAPRALAVNVTPRAQGLAAEPEPDNVPPQVRQIESQIERQARRYRAGASIGAALDPELISVNAFATFGPFFSRNFSVRPNLEFAFGEVTTLFGINFDGLYTLPGITRTAKWAPYIGAGPSFTFSHRGFEDTTIENNTVSRFDFGEFEWHNGMNFIVGVRNPNGVFFEMKSTAWGAANVRMLGGFEF